MAYFTHNNGNTIILTINLNYPESKGKGSSISKEIFKKNKVGELTLSTSSHTIKLL